MSAVGSLSTAVTALRKNPVILFGALFLVLLSETYVLLDVYVGSISPLFVWPIGLLIVPFVLGGFIAMIDDALAGSTSVGAFVRGGRDNYVSMLGATIIFVLALVAVSFVGGVLMVVVLLATAVTGAGGFASLVAGFAVVMLVVGILFMFLQFYAAGVVVSDLGAADSFSHSLRLVSSNLASVFGFSVLFVVVSWLGQGPGMALYVLSVEFTEAGDTILVSESMLALSVAVTLVLGTVTMAYAYTYHVAYYASLVADESVSGVAE